MALSPVRPAAVVLHDRLDGPEVGLELHAVILVNRDVGGRPTVGGRQQGVIARDQAQLDREPHPQPAPLDQGQHPFERLGRVLARDRVLHLREAHEPRVGVHAVARVQMLGAAHQRGQAPVYRGDRGREAPAEPTGGVEDRVLDQYVAQERARRRPRARPPIRPLGAESERHTGVRQRERLPVVVRFRELVEAGKHLVERARLVDPMNREGGNAAKRDRRDGAERAQADPGGAQLVAVAHVEQVAAARHDPDAHHLRGEVAEERARAVSGRRDSAAESLRVNVALVLHREPARGELLAELAQGDPGLDGHVLPGDVEYPVHPREVDHHAVGAGDVVEGVARAGDLYPPRPRDRADELLLGARPLDALRRAALVARPVRPDPGHPAVRATTPRTRAAAPEEPSGPRGPPGCRADRPRRRAPLCSRCRRP